MRKFNPLTIKEIRPETRDSVRMSFDVPEELQDDYDFLPGQHLPFEIQLDGKKLRRTYSICSAQGQPLEIGIRVQPGGQFSEYAAEQLGAGDSIQAMPPSGQFRVELDPNNEKDYVGFAAGSGITPILSMIKSILETEPKSRFILFYGNRTQATTMFIEDLYELKNKYMERLQLNFVFSREEQEFAPMAGRLDGDKVRELYKHFGAGLRANDCFVCGPDTMIQDVTEALIDLGMRKEHVHFERFGVPRKKTDEKPVVQAKAADHAEVTIIMDGHKKVFAMERDDANIVDAAADHGIELPYSCKGGVCATCRCHVRDGEVTMDANFGLEPWEVEKGFILACQSHPVSEKITLDYDKV